MFRPKLLLIALACVLLAPACGSGDDHGAHTSPTGIPTVSEEEGPPVDDDTVTVTLNEWSVVAEHASVQDGEITFTTSNEGEHEHELAIVRTDLDAGALPTKDDGSVDVAGLDVVDRVASLETDASGEVTLDLDKGDYVLVCNLVDETAGTLHVHYQLGMRTPLRVG